jgi:hypothetical protein
MRVGIERLAQKPAAAGAGNAARAEAVDGEGDISPGGHPIGERRGVARKAGAAMQYDDRGIGSATVGRAAEHCRQTGIRSRQIAGESRWFLSRKVRKFDQGAGRGGAGTEQ